MNIRNALADAMQAPNDNIRNYHILSLGAGVQSTALYLMLSGGGMVTDGKPARLDAAIFADTGEEPDAVYAHLKWLQGLNGSQILVRSKGGRLGEHLKHGVNSTGQRFASIPVYTMAAGDKREGRTRRQCSREYKSAVVERAIRREILGLKPRQRIPKDAHVMHYFGISLDEAGRARRIAERFRRDIKWATPVFPLIDLGMTRAACRTYLAEHVPHTVRRSSCVFCPYHSDSEWLRLKEHDTNGWDRAVEIDRALRVPGNIVNRNMDKQLFLHRSCEPLEDVQFSVSDDPREAQLSLGFVAECEGMCGV